VKRHDIDANAFHLIQLVDARMSDERQGETAPSMTLLEVDRTSA
jgi:hypothetical protein